MESSVVFVLPIIYQFEIGKLVGVENTFETDPSRQDLKKSVSNALETKTDDSRTTSLHKISSCHSKHT